MDNGVTQTQLAPLRVDLVKSDFDKLVVQKGKEVAIEKAIECPCASPSTGGALSDCKNCGGLGYIWLEPTESRVVLTGIAVTNDYRPWSEEMRGMVNITALHEEELSFMDRITDVNGEGIFNELLFVKTKQGQKFAYSTYPIKQLIYIAQFNGSTNPLKKLQEGVDFEIDPKRYMVRFMSHIEGTVTIRYKHAPQFVVIEMKRETMQSAVWTNPGEKVDSFPISAIGRRAHFQLKMKNINEDNIIENKL